YGSPAGRPLPSRIDALRLSGWPSPAVPDRSPTALRLAVPCRPGSKPHGAPAGRPLPSRAELQRPSGAANPARPGRRPTPPRLAVPRRPGSKPYGAPAGRPLPSRLAKNRTNTERSATIVRETARGRNNRQVSVTLQPAQALRGGIIRLRGGIIQTVG